MLDVTPTPAFCDTQLGGGFIPTVRTAFISQEVQPSVDYSFIPSFTQQIFAQPLL